MATHHAEPRATAAATLPPAFVIAVVLSVGVGLVLGALVTYAETPSREAQTWLAQVSRFGRPLIYIATSLAVSTLLIAGFLDLARRAGPGSDGTLLRVGGAAAGVLIAVSLVGIYTHFWWLPGGSGRTRIETMQTVWEWRSRVSCAAGLAISGVLLVAGRRVALVGALAVPLLIATVFEFPPRAVIEILSWTNPSSSERWLQLFVDTAIDAAFGGLLLTVVAALAQTLPPSPVDRPRAGEGLERAGSALVARVLVAVVGVFILVSTFASHSIGLAKVTALAFPGGMLIASLALVTGVLQAGGLATPGAPRGRFHVAAVLLLGGLVIEGLKALAVYRGLTLVGANHDRAHDLDTLRRTVEALPYLTPALTLAGLLCLLSAVAEVRRDTPDARVDEAALTGAATVVVIGSVGAVAILRWAHTGGATSLGGGIVVAIIAAIAGVIAQLAVARACHRVGAALRETPGLPTAVVTVGRPTT